MTELVQSAFDVVETRTLGSPVMLASIAETPLAASLFPLYERTQWITWWRSQSDGNRCPMRDPALTDDSARHCRWNVADPEPSLVGVRETV